MASSYAVERGGQLGSNDRVQRRLATYEKDVHNGSALNIFSYSDYGAIVYRLGHQVFILRSGVRLPVALPS